jgi:hypothetical protein
MKETTTEEIISKKIEERKTLIPDSRPQIREHHSVSFSYPVFTKENKNLL